MLQHVVSVLRYTLPKNFSIPSKILEMLNPFVGNEHVHGESNFILGTLGVIISKFHVQMKFLFANRIFPDGMPRHIWDYAGCQCPIKRARHIFVLPCLILE